jgi:peptide-methionine (S)-S-oxide reductase
MPDDAEADRAGAEERVTLGGGCFWCMEAIFDQIEGVTDVRSGYSGGETSDPTYEEVSTGKTGHAEVVQVTFDPRIISLGEILEIFFDAHDPTTPNRQGNDIGPQYRSIILHRDEAQRAVAEGMIDRLNSEGKYPSRIVTEVRPLKAFYPAETYHDDHFKRNPSQAYCRLVIAPKVSKMKRHFGDRLKG